MLGMQKAGSQMIGFLNSKLENKAKAIDQSKQAVIWLHPQALVAFMTSQRWVIKEGQLPEDVQYHHVYFDQERNVFGLVVLSNSFKSLKVGEKRPELPPITFKWWNPKDGEIK